MVTEQGSRTCSEHWRRHVIQPLALITALASLLLAVPSVPAEDDGRIGFTIRDAPEPLVVDLLCPDAPERGEPLGLLPEGAIDALVHDVLALVMRTGHSRVAVRFSQVPGETAQPHVVALLDRLQAEETKIEFAIWNLGSESWQGDGVQAHLLNRVDAFVLARSLILHNGGVSETQFVRDSLGGLLQASNGRAILMRTNGRWREIRASGQSDRVEILDPAATLRTGTRRGPLDWNSLDGPHAQRAAGSHGPASGAPSSDGGSGAGGGSGDGSSSSDGGGGGGGGGGSGSGGGAYGGGSGGIAGGGAVTGDTTIAFSPKTGQHGILVRCGGSPKTQQNPLGVATQMLVNPKAFFKKHVNRAKQLHAITGNARVVFHMINGWDTEGMTHSGAVLGAMPDARKVEFIKAVNELTAAGITVGVYFASRVPKSSTSVYIADAAPVEPFDFSNPAHLNMTVEQIMQPLLDIGVTELWLDSGSSPAHRYQIALLADYMRQRGGYVVMEAMPRMGQGYAPLDMAVLDHMAAVALTRYIYLHNDLKNDLWMPLPTNTELIAIISGHQTIDNSVPTDPQERLEYLAEQTQKRLEQGFTVFNMDEPLDEKYFEIIDEWVN